MVLAMRTGICTTDFEKPGAAPMPAEQLFAAVRELGLSCVQFAFSSIAECGFTPTGQIEIPASIPPPALRNTQKYAAQYALPIEVINGTFNMAHPDVEVRWEGLRRLAVLVDAAVHLGVKYISLCSGDLCRAMQTAEILTEALHLPIIQLPEFRETNNGYLAGMKNELAKQKYPGLYWSALSWDERYLNGESPREFYQRIRTAWMRFESDIREKGENAMLVTHSGVISVILHLIMDKPYSNKGEKLPIGYVTPVVLELHRTPEGSNWIYSEGNSSNVQRI